MRSTCLPILPSLIFCLTCDIPYVISRTTPNLQISSSQVKTLMEIIQKWRLWYSRRVYVMKIKGSWKTMQEGKEWFGKGPDFKIMTENFIHHFYNFTFSSVIWRTESRCSTCSNCHTRVFLLADQFGIYDIFVGLYISGS